MNALSGTTKLPPARKAIDLYWKPSGMAAGELGCKRGIREDQPTNWAVFGAKATGGDP